MKIPVCAKHKKPMQLVRGSKDEYMCEDPSCEEVVKTEMDHPVVATDVTCSVCGSKEPKDVKAGWMEKKKESSEEMEKFCSQECMGKKHSAEGEGETVAKIKEVLGKMSSLLRDWRAIAEDLPEHIQEDPVMVNGHSRKAAKLANEYMDLYDEFDRLGEKLFVEMKENVDDYQSLLQKLIPKDLSTNDPVDAGVWSLGSQKKSSAAKIELPTKEGETVQRPASLKSFLTVHNAIVQGGMTVELCKKGSLLEDAKKVVSKYSKKSQKFNSLIAKYLKALEKPEEDRDRIFDETDTEYFDEADGLEKEIKERYEEDKQHRQEVGASQEKVESNSGEWRWDSKDEHASGGLYLDDKEETGVGVVFDEEQGVWKWRFSRSYCRDDWQPAKSKEEAMTLAQNELKERVPSSLLKNVKWASQEKEGSISKRSSWNSKFVKLKDNRVGRVEKHPEKENVHLFDEIKEREGGGHYYTQPVHSMKPEEVTEEQIQEEVPFSSFNFEEAKKRDQPKYSPTFASQEKRRFLSASGLMHEPLPLGELMVMEDEEKDGEIVVKDVKDGDKEVLRTVDPFVEDPEMIRKFLGDLTKLLNDKYKHEKEEHDKDKEQLLVKEKELGETKQEITKEKGEHEKKNNEFKVLEQNFASLRGQLTKAHFDLKNLKCQSILRDMTRLGKIQIKAEDVETLMKQGNGVFDAKSKAATMAVNREMNKLLGKSDSELTTLSSELVTLAKKASQDGQSSSSFVLGNVRMSQDNRGMSTLNEEQALEVIFNSMGSGGNLPRVK